jgi:hypothetical protein
MKNIEEKLFNIIDKIQSKSEFIEFIILYRTYVSQNIKSIENDTLEKYLEAMEAFIQSSDNYYENNGIEMKTINPWRIFADLLMASLVYE